MKSFKTIVLGICLALTLAACDQAVWYDTKEEAIENGLEDKARGVTVEEYKGETIVLYEYEGALGAASITESEKGYHWYRSAPYHGFDATGDLPYATGGFTFETEAGAEVAILYGTIFDPMMDINEVASREELTEVTMLDESDLFYTLLE